MRQFSGCSVGHKGVAAARFAVAVCLGLVVLANVAKSESRLISQEQALRLGLKRAWFTQVRLDRARNHVERAVLEGNQLTVLTTAGVVQELNAQTGETLWIAPIGNENYPSLGPTCSEQHVALVNGSTLYVLDRKDGRPVIIRQVGGAPGAAPALATKYVYVPLVRGRVEGYPLDAKKKLTPWYYQSQGRTMVAPLATPESVVWTTESGYLYVGRSDDPKVRFRLETGSEILASPAYLKPFVYVAAASGELFAMNEMTGERRWKYATGFPVTRAAAPVGSRVFVTSDEPSLHCVDAASGNMLWEAPRVSQFSAASKERVYGVDDLGALVVLDGAKGTLLGRLATDHAINTLVNDQTDRIYLVSDAGVIECLHELGATMPLEHNPKPVEEQKPEAGETKAPTTTAPPAAPPKAPAEPSDEATPFEDQAKEPEAPADKEPEKPAGDFGVEENPFGN